ncbi:GNAT family N-acetyltransferase [Algicella marina]|uniref:N-acetyltransferase n=1 Tax=Algicella marina TaxID=2683284 RepID=A0A6P1SX55_9RHOB|nr:GNAT family N-acetyltransferase [Algicella marina]QHQ35254.1 N-acetyltransferase [Algicella marina]
MIRVMTLADMETVLGWAQDEGWNPGLEDAAAYLAADPSGFLVNEQAGRPVAAVSVVNHTDNFAFLGLYLCHPEYRGRGFGYETWLAGLEHAGDRTIGLDGVPAQQANYRKSGFDMSGKTFRYEGRIPPIRCDAITPPRDKESNLLVHRYEEAFGYSMPTFLTHWFSDTKNRRTFILRDGSLLRGAVTIRRCAEGCKAGPLFATTAEEAKLLLAHGASVFGVDQITIDIPDTQSLPSEFERISGLACSFTTARMYRGTPPSPETSFAGLVSTATLELG